MKKLTTQLLDDITSYWRINKKVFNSRIMYPINEEYLKLFKPEVVYNFMLPLGYFVNGSGETIPFDEGIKYISTDHQNKLDLVIKGGILLYSEEIISFTELKRLLNIGSQTHIPLYRTNGQIGAFEIVSSLIAILFGKVTYDPGYTSTEYIFERKTYNSYYRDIPTYYYGLKTKMSYGNITELMDNIEWFLESNPDLIVSDFPDKHDVMGMVRVNDVNADKIFAKEGIDKNVLTEITELPIYNIGLNIYTDSYISIGNTLFDFYKAVKERTMITENGTDFITIDFTEIEPYVKYITTVKNLEIDYQKLEKCGLILKKMQNFLIC